MEWVAIPFSRGASWPRVWTQLQTDSLLSELPGWKPLCRVEPPGSGERGSSGGRTVPHPPVSPSLLGNLSVLGRMWVHHVYWVALFWVYTVQRVFTQLRRSQPAGIGRFSSQIGWKSSSILRLEQILVNHVAQWFLLGSMLVCDGDQHQFLLVHEEMKKVNEVRCPWS